jgi:hypothetical protein
MATVCAVCLNPPQEDRPLVRAQVRRRDGRRWISRWEAVCFDCSLVQSEDVRVWPSGLLSEMEQVSCVSCGVPVLLMPDPRRKVSACSDLCRVRSYYAAPRPVGQPVTGHRCEGCGELMEGGRSDRRYCSSACRQSAYRERSRTLTLN